MSGSLATGTVMVKQDLRRMDHLFKPVDWRPCFFALIGHSLFCFADRYSMRLIGSVHLSRDSLAYATPLAPHSFALVTPWAVIHLVASTRHVAKAWVRALHERIASAPVKGFLEPSSARAAKRAAVRGMRNEYEVRFEEKKPLMMKLKPKTPTWYASQSVESVASCLPLFLCFRAAPITFLTPSSFHCDA